MDFSRRGYFKTRENNDVMFTHQFMNTIHSVHIAMIGNAKYLDIFFMADPEQLQIVLLFAHAMVSAAKPDVIVRIDLQGTFPELRFGVFSTHGQPPFGPCVFLPGSGDDR